MSLALDLDLQTATTAPNLPGQADFERWTAAALAGRRTRAALTIRVVNPAEGQALNLRFRGRDQVTNVLSFPFEAPPQLAGLDDGIDALLGDLVICAPVVQREAQEQGKPTDAHWAHLVVHGVLHLLGYDHLAEDEAAAMAALEKTILAGLGFPPPYQDDP